jgi:hypothetical protein
MPHVNLSPLTLTQTYGHYLLVRLKAVPEVAHVLEYFQSVVDAFQGAIKAHQDAVMARHAATAVRDFHNDRMDAETRILAFTILGRVRNNRAAPIFRHYFARGYSEVLQTPILDQRRRSHVLLEKLEAERDEVIHARLEPFRAQLQALEEALAAFEQTRDTEARMRGIREAAKQEWLEGYRRTFHQLQDHYSSDPRQAESFFRPAAGRERNRV